MVEIEIVLAGITITLVLIGIHIFFKEVKEMKEMKKNENM